jgi:dihydrofolate synthase/folylpolyglutamate synthase
MTWIAPVPVPSFSEAREWLTSLEPLGIRLGLERVEAALDALRIPYRELRAVTIAGTNGKGSTASFMAAIAHAAGYRVGLYTSPHLVCPTERIRLGGMAILPDDFAGWAERTRAVVEGRVGPPVPLTYFEAMTVMALGYFCEREVDLAVLEVGLGGRLDATAVVPALVDVLTPIGLDHQAILGLDLESIAREKAGVIRSRATVVCHVLPELFRTVVGPRAFDLRCPVRRYGVDFQGQWLRGRFRYRGWIHRVGPLQLSLAGFHQGENAALACAAAESLAACGFTFKPVHLGEGLTRARHRGRLERWPAFIDPAGRRWPALLLDAAHNPMGAATLGRQMASFLPERPRVLLFACRPDKDLAGILKEVAPRCDAVVLTQATSLAGAAHGYGVARSLCPRVMLEPDLEAAMELARSEAGPEGGILVTGSIYLLGDVLKALPGQGGPRLVTRV